MAADIARPLPSPDRVTGFASACEGVAASAVSDMLPGQNCAFAVILSGWRKVREE